MDVLDFVSKICPNNIEQFDTKNGSLYNISKEILMTKLVENFPEFDFDFSCIIDKVTHQTIIVFKQYILLYNFVIEDFPSLPKNYYVGIHNSKINSFTVDNDIMLDSTKINEMTCNLIPEKNFVNSCSISNSEVNYLNCENIYSMKNTSISSIVNENSHIPLDVS